MTITDTAAAMGARDAAAMSSFGTTDAVNDPMQDAQLAIESTDREADRKIGGARAGMAHSGRQSQARLRRGGTLSQRAREARESSVDYIRQNPWRAIGISASAALLVGVIIGRSMVA